MATLLQAQKSLTIQPVVNLTIGSASVGQYVDRYKYREKANSFGRCSIWLDNGANRFGDLPGDWPDIVRGAEVVLDRGLVSGGQELTAALPTLWVETIQFITFRDLPFLYLDCIDWAGRLRYYRYATEQTWSGTLVESIVSSILSEVGLSLASGSWSTSLSIDYTISTKRTAWSALLDLLSKVPEVLYAGLDKEIQHKVLDSTSAASYDYGYNPPPGSTKHPLLSDTDVSESTARYNSVTVEGGSSLQYSGTAEDSGEIALLGYRRRRAITDRSLGSNQECADRAEAELEQWLARSASGIAVSRPNFTARLYDVISAEPPIWGGPATPAGHVTRIIEWFNFPGREFDQALTYGEVPNDAKVDLGPPGQTSSPNPPPVDDAVNSDSTDDDDSSATVDEDSIEDGAITTGKIADNSITQAKMQNDSIGTAEIQNGAVTGVKIAVDAVTQTKIQDGAVSGPKIASDSISQDKMENDSVGTPELIDGSVTSAKLAPDSVTQSKIVDGAISSAKLASNSVSLAKMQNNSVGTAEIVNEAVTAAKIGSGAAASGQVLTADGASGADWATPAAAGEANTASNAGTGGVGVYDNKSGVDLRFRNINAASGGSLTVTLDSGNKEIDLDVADSGIGTTELAAGAVTTAKLADNAVTNAKMADDSVDTAEIVDNAVEPAKMAALNALVSIAADTVATGTLDTLQYTVEIFDNGGFHGSPNTQLTVPTGRAGLYFITANVIWDTPSSALITYVSIVKNDSTIIASDSKEWGSTSDSPEHNLSTIRDMSAGDYVEVKVQHDMGSNLNAASTFGIAFVGPP